MKTINNLIANLTPKFFWTMLFIIALATFALAGVRDHSI